MTTYPSSLEQRFDQTIIEYEKRIKLLEMRLDAAASIINQLQVQTTFLLNPAFAVLYQITTQSIPNSSWTPLALDGSVVDYFGGHNTVTHNSRYTSQRDGWYECCGTVAFPTNGTGARGVRLAVDGTVITGSATFDGTTVGDVWAGTTPAFMVLLFAGHYVEVEGFQTSGAPLSTDVAASDIRSSMNVRWVSSP